MVGNHGRTRLLRRAVAVVASLLLVSALGAAVAMAAQPLTITLYQVSCPSYSYVPANDSYNNAAYDATGGHTAELNTNSNRGTAAVSDIDSHCTRMAGWQFNLHRNSANGTAVSGSPVATGADGYVDVQLSSDDATRARTGSGIWVDEVVPAGYGFAGLRCYDDMMYSDNSEQVSGVDADVTHVYCIAFNVGRTLTITAGNQAKTYGASASLGTTSFTTSGLLAGDSVSHVTLTSTGSAATAAVGSYSIVPSAAIGSGLANYHTITYVPGSLSVTAKALTVTAANQPKEYGSVANLGTTGFAASGLVNSDMVDSVSLTSTGSAAAAVVGSYPIVPSAATGTGLGNYSISYANGSLSVSAKPLTVTATNQSKEYGSALDLGTTAFSAPGLVNGNTVTGVTLTSAGAAAAAAIGNYPIVPSAATGTGLGNYAISYANGSLSVSTKPLTITATDQTKVYGSTLDLGTTGFDASGLLPGDTVTGVTLASAGAAATAAVGDYTITPSAAVGTGLAGYAIAYGDGMLSVTKAALTITAPNVTKLRGSANPVFTPTYTGLAGGDSAASLTTQPSCVTTATTDSPVGTYPITCSDAASSNYDFTYVAGTLTVAFGTLDHIVVSPDPATIVAGTTKSYTAEGFDSQGNSLGDVTAATTFTIDGSGSSCTSAACGSTVVGDYTVTGTDGELSDTAILHVVAAPATATPTATGSQIVAGATATPTASATGSQDLLGATSVPNATPPATSTPSGNTGGSGTPLFALFICLAFGALAVVMAEKQRRTVHN